jgi:hypothetical protein
MEITILGEIEDIQTIAAGRGVRQRGRLRTSYGGWRWRKMKGLARVQRPDGSVRRAEIHWFEAHGVGAREFKVKRYMDES